MAGEGFSSSFNVELGARMICPQSQYHGTREKQIRTGKKGNVAEKLTSPTCKRDVCYLFVKCVVSNLQRSHTPTNI